MFLSYGFDWQEILSKIDKKTEEENHFCIVVFSQVPMWD